MLVQKIQMKKLELSMNESKVSSTISRNEAQQKIQSINHELNFSIKSNDINLKQSQTQLIENINKKYFKSPIISIPVEDSEPSSPFKSSGSPSPVMDLA